jgi:hypothetical protein
MGRSEVLARWPTITICTSVGSTVSNMIANVHRATACVWRRAKGLERQSGVMYID